MLDYEYKLSFLVTEIGSIILAVLQLGKLKQEILAVLFKDRQLPIISQT